VAGLAIVAGGFFLVKNFISAKSGTTAPVVVTPPSDQALSANEVFKRCMPSICMLTIKYKAKAVLNKKFDLTDVDGEPLLITNDDQDNLTFYDKENKPSKTAVGMTKIGGTKFGVYLKIKGHTLTGQFYTVEGVPVTKGGKPLIVDTGFELDSYGATATGSGFFVRPDVVATNFHVVSEGTVGSAAFSSGVAQITDKPAKYEIIEKPIYVDAVHDLALIYVPGTDAKPLALHPDVADLKVGDPVYALGSPKGFNGSISEGVISSDRLRADPEKPEGERYLIQTSAKIDHGNSGGPLVNDRGEVIGVDVMMVGKAIFLSIAEKEVDELLNRPEVIAKIAELQKNSQSDLTGGK